MPAATVPPYTARKSQNELKALAAIDPSLKGLLCPVLRACHYVNARPEKILKRVKKSKVVLSKQQTKPVNGGSRVSGSKDSPTSASSVSDTSDYDSDFSSDSDSEMAEPSPLPATRPQAALEAVRYDTIKAVWLPRNVYASADSIRAGLAEFWEVTKTIRDRWRTDSDAVKAATEANKIGELPLLKERVDKQRDMLQAALKAAIEHGHPDIMRLYVYSPHAPIIPTKCSPIFSLKNSLICGKKSCELCDADPEGKHNCEQRTHLLFMVGPLGASRFHVVQFSNPTELYTMAWYALLPLYLGSALKSGVLPASICRTVYCCHSKCSLIIDFKSKLALIAKMISSHRFPVVLLHKT
jgi:hypothetical protein